MVIHAYDQLKFSYRLHTGEFVNDVLLTTPSGVVHWVPKQLNIKAVTGTCKLIDGCSLALCSATVSVVSAGICHRNEVNIIA